MPTIINTKFGENRGAARIWLEGGKLAREGYSPGLNYDLELAQKRIVLTPSPKGQYTISKRQRNGRLYPVIDIARQDLADLFDGVETLRVLVTKGRIVITPHHQEAKVAERVDRLMSRLEKNDPLRVCSLFHGGGCVDSALHAGLDQRGVPSKIGVAVELEGKYLESSLANNRELWDEQSIAIESPIQMVDLGRSPTQMDVVIAGIPCTGASRAGKSKNKNEFAESHESAGAMFFNFLNFVQLLNPAIVIIENVPDYASTASMAVIRSVLGTLGYDLQERVFDGNEFGALEARKRLCAVAITRGLDHAFVLDDVAPHMSKPKKLADILETIPNEAANWKTYDYLAEKAVRDKAEGKGFARQLLTGDEPRCGTIGRGYSKARSTEPFIRHPDPSRAQYSRLLTPVEHARVKGIPVSTIQGLAATTAHEILGQAIIYPVFEAIGMALGNALMRVAGKNTESLINVKVRTVDPHNDGFLGGEDLGIAPALLDLDTGQIRLVGTGCGTGWPFLILDDSIVILDSQDMEITLLCTRLGDEPGWELACDRQEESIAGQGLTAYLDRYAVNRVFQAPQTIMSMPLVA